METINYRELKMDEIDRALFKNFNRFQEVKKCWRKENEEWILKAVPFTEQWSSEEYEYLVKCLKNTAKTDGIVMGAYLNDVMVGFASIENQFFGAKQEYLQLSSIHTSFESRGAGIGKQLFFLACEKAKEMGAKKLYISAHSSEETQAFYKGMGCVEAIEYNKKLVMEEPFDCQLEFNLMDIYK